MTFDGVRFNLVSVTAGDRSVTAFVTATNISDGKIRLMPFAYSAPRAIDDQGNVSTVLAIRGIRGCSSASAANCMRPDREWSEAYPNSPLNIILQFAGSDSFTGSTLALSFGAFIAVGTADGEYRRPTLVPVAFANVPLKTGAVPATPLAGTTYDGVRFEVARVMALERRMLVHVIATNTLDRKVKLQPFGYSEPQAIDDRGNTSTGSVEFSGIPVCASASLSNCMAPEREWSNAYPNSPLNIVLQFYTQEGFSGTSAAISFGVLVGSDEEDGRIGSPKLIPVSFAGLPLKSRQ